MMERKKEEVWKGSYNNVLWRGEEKGRERKMIENNNRKNKNDSGRSFNERNYNWID